MSSEAHPERKDGSSNASSQEERQTMAPDNVDHAYEQVKELQLKIKELEQKSSTLSTENTRLKNELRFVNEHQRRMADDQIASLHHDIDMISARNEQLSSELMQTEAELQSVKQSKTQSDSEYTANITSQSSALVERLSAAQRDRENTLLAQLNKALKEKEKALLILNKMDVDTEDITGMSDSEVDKSPAEKGLQELVESLRGANGVLELQRNGGLLVERVKELRDDNQRRIQDQLNLLRQESEAARCKKLALDNEVIRLRRQLEIMETEYKLVDKTRVKTLQAQLQAVLNEKDQWQQRANKFEDTCETLRVLSSLQRSLSKEDEIKKKYEKELQRCHQETLVLTTQLERALQERNTAVKDTNLVIQERNALALQAQQEYERAERFQRLVVVLRRKAAMSSAGSTKSPVNPAYEV